MSPFKLRVEVKEGKQYSYAAPALRLATTLVVSLSQSRRNRKSDICPIFLLARRRLGVIGLVVTTLHSARQQ